VAWRETITAEKLYRTEELSIAFIRSWSPHNRSPLPQISINDRPNTGQSGRFARCIAGLYSGHEYPYDLPVAQSRLANIVTVETDSVDATLRLRGIASHAIGPPDRQSLRAARAPSLSRISGVTTVHCRIPCTAAAQEGCSGNRQAQGGASPAPICGSPHAVSHRPKVVIFPLEHP
jgi:hypothetical protein